MAGFRWGFLFLGCGVCCLSIGIFCQAEPLATPKLQQLVLALAESPQSSRGKLQLFSREVGGKWQPQSSVWPVNFGRRGLAWGRGRHPAQPGPQKREKDGCTPAGRFLIGLVLSNEPQLPARAHPELPFHHKTAFDAWIGDSHHPHYNHLVTIQPHEINETWFQKERFKLDDKTYQWLVLIEHNYPQAQPYAGSAIFFHQQRTRKSKPQPTAGCTSMTPERLQKLIQWLDPNAHPEYVVLTFQDYQRLRQPWDLPYFPTP